MRVWVWVPALLAAALVLPGAALGQDPSLATFQETAQVIVDKSISGNVTASVTLQSTSIQEIRIPAELERQMREDGRIEAVVLTNEDRCVLGVSGMSCILVNVSRDPEAEGIFAIQDSSRGVADGFIGGLNGAFDTGAEFHSVFVHSDDASNRALGTSGVISGRGAVSVVYTMPLEETGSMYEKISALVLPGEIRGAGGFYGTAVEMSQQEGAKMALSIIPSPAGSLMQLKVSVDRPGAAEGLVEIDPLGLLGTERLERSGYFDAGFYPLNSLVQVVVLSPGNASVSAVSGRIAPTALAGGERVPTDVSQPGWVFDPEAGQRIQGMYIFGGDDAALPGDLAFELGGPAPGGTAAPAGGPGGWQDAGSVAAAAAIIAAAAAAAAFYLRGYRGRSD